MLVPQILFFTLRAISPASLHPACAFYCPVQLGLASVREGHKHTYPQGLESPREEQIHQDQRIQGHRFP